MKKGSILNDSWKYQKILAMGMAVYSQGKSIQSLTLVLIILFIEINAVKVLILDYWVFHEMNLELISNVRSA